MTSAFAGAEAPTTHPATANPSDPPGTDVALADTSAANPTAESSAAAGGALFSPFAASPAAPKRRQPAGASYQSTEGDDLAFSAAAAVGAIAAIGFILRRVSR